MAETDYKNFHTVISKGTSLASSIYLGVNAGSPIAGPWGAAAGAVIAATGFAISEVSNYQQRMSNYYQNLNATNYQTEFDRTRAGLTNEGKGTEN